MKPHPFRAWRARIVPGVVLECIENTYRPELNGAKRVVLKVGTTVWLFRPVDGSEISRSEWPRRLSDVVMIDKNTSRYPLTRTAHTLTLRILEELA